MIRESSVSLLSFVLSLALQQFGVSEYGEKLALLLNESIFSSVYACMTFYFIALLLILVISFRKAKDIQVRKCKGLTLIMPSSLFLYRSPYEQEFSDISLESACSSHSH